MKTLSSERLLLKELTTADAIAVYTIYSNPDFIKQYEGNPIPEFAETVPFIEKITSNGNYVWNIRLRDDHEKIIGVCALHDFNAQEAAIEIGGTLLPEYWGQGIMPDAFNLLCENAANELKAEKMIGRTLTPKQSSYRVGGEIRIRKTRD